MMNRCCLLVLLFSPLVTVADDTVCENATIKSVKVSVDSSRVVRAIAPKEIFGFNVPWYGFQVGFVRDAKVRQDLIDLMRPFEGASYRYPGGSPSNWFEWKKAIGKASMRIAQNADYNRYAKAEFGVPEFSAFVQSVAGRALFTVNLSGPYGEEYSPEEAARNSAEFVQYVKNFSAFKCAGGDQCRVMGWELGNELDWSPYKWPADVYTKRSRLAVKAGLLVAPNSSWIASGMTAPWNERSKAYSEFNERGANDLSDIVGGLSIHPYYDGVTIPEVLRYVDQYAATWRSRRSDAKVYVTEHARWPSQPKVGKWNNNWYKATSLGGAISSADFLLALIPDEKVASANWHALSVEGPWQLIRWDRSRDAIYPSPVYWGFRVLREAYLDKVVKIDYTQQSEYAYKGGYDQRMVAMRTDDGNRVSVLGVNRSDKPLRLQIRWVGGPRSSGVGIVRWVSSLSVEDDNTDGESNRVTMLTGHKNLKAGRTTTEWCIPSRSVYSVSEP